MPSVDPRSLRRVRWAVRAALLLGIAASVAANVLHAVPNLVAQTIAAWPPLALLLTVELIARVPAYRRSLAVLRFAATGAIAGIAAWVSYWHMCGVAQRYGERGAAPYLIPLSVDGLIVITSVCLVELNGRLRDATSDPDTPTRAPVNPAPPGDPSAQVNPADPDDTPTDPDGRDIDPAARRAEALAALARPDADVAAIAAAAAVTVETLQRWADGAAKRTRRPRGGRRIIAPEPAAEREPQDVDTGAVPVSQ